jgi:hypothetical protein
MARTTPYDPDVFVDAIAEYGGTATTTEVYETVGCHRETAVQELKRLTVDDDSDVMCRKVGKRYLWYFDGALPR